MMDEDEARKRLNEIIEALPRLLSDNAKKDSIIESLRSELDHMKISLELMERLQEDLKEENADLDFDNRNLRFINKENSRLFKELLEQYSFLEAENSSILHLIKQLLEGTLDIEDLRETKRELNSIRKEEELEEYFDNQDFSSKAFELKELTEDDKSHIEFFSYLLSEIDSVEDFLKASE